MCVLKAFRLWDQHACLLVSLTASPLCQPACLFVLKQVLHIVIPPPGSSGGENLNSVTEPQRQSAERWMAQQKERTKHPTLSFQFILSSYTGRPVPPELGSFQFL